MKRLPMVLVLMLAVIGPHAEAHPGHERPKITTFRWVDPPLKTGGEETLKITAHDPDSSISEIQVGWQDTNHEGGVIFAHSYCLQGTQPGKPHTMLLPIVFDQAGAYDVQARAISEKRCEGGNETRTSPWVRKSVTVYDPYKEVSDPDDSPGALDIETVSHTLAEDEATLKRLVVHTVRTVEPWQPSALADGTRIELLFDTGRENPGPERKLLVYTEDGQILTADLIDVATGEVIGHPEVTRADDHSVTATLRPKDLAAGLDVYRWNARSVFLDAASPDCSNVACIDRAPDEGRIRHAL